MSSKAAKKQAEIAAAQEQKRREAVNSLVLAAANESVSDEAIVKLLQSGVDVNAAFNSGRSKRTMGNGRRALLEAISLDRVSTVKILLEHGADPNLEGEIDLESSSLFSRFQTFTPLMLALENEFGKEQPEIVDMLLSAGADPKIERKGKTALGRAVTGHSPRSVERLLQLRSVKNELNMRVTDGPTYFINIVRCFPRDPLSNWWTHRERRLRTQREILTIMRRAGGLVDIPGVRGETQLAAVARRYHSLHDISTLKMLISMGADPSLKNIEGITPLDLVGSDFDHNPPGGQIWGINPPPFTPAVKEQIRGEMRAARAEYLQLLRDENYARRKNALTALTGSGLRPMARHIAAARKVQEAADKRVPLPPVSRRTAADNHAYLINAVLGDNGFQRRILSFL
jgi:hypothetical protein